MAKGASKRWVVRGTNIEERAREWLVRGASKGEGGKRSEWVLKGAVERIGVGGLGEGLHHNYSVCVARASLCREQASQIGMYGPLVSRGCTGCCAK